MAVNENQERALLLQSMDGELSPAEQAALAAALARSPGLREEQRQFVAMRGLLASLQAPPAPGFAEGVMGRLQAQQQEAQVVSLVLRLAAACLILFALGFLLSLYWEQGALDADTILGLEGLAPDDAYSLLEF
jgi:anti-sigma factor RsiW